MSRQTSRLDAKKVNSELLTLTYGALVSQMLKETENAEDVNKQLERIGYNMGVRLIEDFLARTTSTRCLEMRETADKIQQAFSPCSMTTVDKDLFDGRINKMTDSAKKSVIVSKQSVKENLVYGGHVTGAGSPTKLYLNMQPTVTSWSSAGDEFSLVWDQCALSEWVEMPNNGLKYCALIPGAIRGALQMVQLEVQCWFVQDQLKGDAVTELRVKYVKRLEDAVPAGED